MSHDPFDPKNLGLPEKELPARKVSLPSVRRRQSCRFLPSVPEEVFIRAAGLPGKALAVYLILWQRSRLAKSQRVVLTTAQLRKFGLSRNEKAAALRHLEAVGLVAVERLPRRNPVVTLLVPPRVDD